MRPSHLTLIMMLTTASLVLCLAGCQPGPAAPAIEFDQQKVDVIRNQIDTFEWE